MVIGGHSTKLLEVGWVLVGGMLMGGKQMQLVLHMLHMVVIQV